MVQLIKKGGLRERANRSRKYLGSENTEATLKPNSYTHTVKNAETAASSSASSTNSETETKTSE
ncbi:hypothetical protein [Acinetobacter sp. GXMZU3951]|jgi:hypothetical protein